MQAGIKVTLNRTIFEESISQVRKILILSKFRYYKFQSFTCMYHQLEQSIGLSSDLFDKSMIIDLGHLKNMSQKSLRAGTLFVAFSAPLST